MHDSSCVSTANTEKARPVGITMKDVPFHYLDRSIYINQPCARCEAAFLRAFRNCERNGNLQHTCRRVFVRLTAANAVLHYGVDRDGGCPPNPELGRFLQRSHNLGRKGRAENKIAHSPILWTGGLRICLEQVHGRSCLQPGDPTLIIPEGAPGLTSVYQKGITRKSGCFQILQGKNNALLQSRDIRV